MWSVSGVNLIEIFIAVVYCLNPMFDYFRLHYPQASLQSEFLGIEHGLFLVCVTVQVEGIVLGNGLAAAPTLEDAEDRARVRAIETVLPSQPKVSDPSAPTMIVPSPSSDLVQPLAPVVFSAQPAVIPANGSSSQPLAPVQLNPDPTPSKKPDKAAIASSKSASKTDSKLDSQKEELVDIPLNQPVLDLELTLETEDLAIAISSEEVSPVVIPLPSLMTDAEENGLIDLGPEESPLLAPLEPIAEVSLETPIASPVSPPIPATEPIDFSDVIARSNRELKRLGWTSEQGRNYLLQTYGKRSRQLLSDEELLEFVQFLEKEPAPART